MASTTLNLRVSPRRMLPLKDAADYCGISAKRFPNECGVAPVKMPDGSRRWDMRDLDVWLDALKGGDDASDDALLSRLG